MSKNRGFAAMDETRRRQIASRGGRAAHEAGSAHEWNGSEAAQAGRKGGQKVSQDRSHMAAIGRKGGLAPRSRKGSSTDANVAPLHEQAAHESGIAGAAQLPAHENGRANSERTEPAESREPVPTGER